MITASVCLQLESVVERHRRLFLSADADPAASVSVIRELKPGVQSSKGLVESSTQRNGQSRSI